MTTSPNSIVKRIALASTSLALAFGAVASDPGPAWNETTRVSTSPNKNDYTSALEVAAEMRSPGFSSAD
jgi:hypothetical protein